jgi:uncharacterized protein
MIAPVVTAFYAGLLGLVGLALAVLVVRGRLIHKVGLGTGGKAEMERPVRVFGNFTEYVPLILVLLALGESLGAPRWAVHAIGAGLLVGRFFHAWGLSRASGTSAGRFIGTNLTWLALVAASVVALWRALAAGAV